MNGKQINGKQMGGNPLTRRGFVKAAGAAFAFPTLIPAQVLGEGPNEKVNLACCGIGNQGAEDINALFKTGLCNIVALCDTEMGSPRTKGIIEKFPDAPQFTDFRKMLDKMDKQVDAVLVATPDHSHFAIAMEAMRRGKAVFVEKPLAHSFHQLELLMAAEKKYKVVTQMGNQGHSDGEYFQYKAYAEQGLMKGVTKVVAHMNNSRRWHKWGGDVAKIKAAIAAPAKTEVDWDTWFAHVDGRQPTEQYLNGEWRCFYEFGNGALGDWGAHILDCTHEFLKLGLPTSVEPLKMAGWNPLTFPMQCTLRFKMPARGEGLPACDVYWHEGRENFPELPEGFGDLPGPGKELVPGKEIYGDGFVFKGGSRVSTLVPVGPTAEAVKARLPKYRGPQNHYENFLLSVKGQDECHSRFSVSGPFCQFMALGVIAMRVNEKIELDLATRRITNHAAADQMLGVGEPPRKGWEEYFSV